MPALFGFDGQPKAPKGSAPARGRCWLGRWWLFNGQPCCALVTTNCPRRYQTELSSSCQTEPSTKLRQKTQPTPSTRGRLMPNPGRMVVLNYLVAAASSCSRRLRFANSSSQPANNAPSAAPLSPTMSFEPVNGSLRSGGCGWPGGNGRSVVGVP